MLSHFARALLVAALMPIAAPAEKDPPKRDKADEGPEHPDLNLLVDVKKIPRYTALRTAGAIPTQKFTGERAQLLVGKRK